MANVPLPVIALNRMAFGPRPGDVDRVAVMGLPAYVDEQLHPDDRDEPEVKQRLAAVRLHIEYEAGKDDKGNLTYKACKEDRPLRHLKSSAAELWKLTDESKFAGEERQQPSFEVEAAAFVRATYSRWQLREVLADFWHNHFNVNAAIDDERAALMWPVYDRDVIRRHSFGNFRQFLEAVATSVPMLIYLNNAASKASPANENFARELFELHTLGADAYFNHLYNRWREVPGSLDGKPVGYIDEDVYEAARAFTGWTIADGQETDRGDKFPNTGEFYYYDGWHDPYQKRVLATEFDPNEPALADGRRVLDLVAAHPATAMHVCTKLCRRLVADNPSAALIDRAATVFRESKDQPDQIARVLRVILLSDEFAATWGQKIKRPFELVVSFLRATEAEVRPDSNLFGIVDGMGQHLFAWPTPAGHPDMAAHWSGTNAMLGRWNAPLTMMADDFVAARFRLERATPATLRTPRELARFWVQRILGYDLPEPELIILAKACARGADLDVPLSVGEKEWVDRLQALVALVAMTPQFQMR
jgi:uncharacterized protein (DUF1800 family)